MASFYRVAAHDESLGERNRLIVGQLRLQFHKSQRRILGLLRIVSVVGKWRPSGVVTAGRVRVRGGVVILAAMLLLSHKAGHFALLRLFTFEKSHDHLGAGGPTPLVHLLG
jgi:hypothetical protein